MLAIAQISLELGLLYSLAVCSIYLSFRILDFPDLTVDGSFTLGGAVSAVLLTLGWHPLSAVLLSALCGFLAGATTAALHSYIRINKILAGILTLTMLYSVNLRVMSGPNIPLLGKETISQVASLIPLPQPFPLLTLYLILSGFILIAVNYFLRTEVGLLIRATGANEQLVRSVAKDPDAFRLLGIGLANLLAAISGSLAAQNFGFADIGLGVGVIVVGFASLLIGEAIVRPRTVRTHLGAALLGSLLYQAIIALALRLGLVPTDLKLVTAVIVIALLAFNRIRQ